MGQRFPISFLEGVVKLSNDELILSRSMSPIYLISRYDTEHGALTWVGRYSSMPTDYADRDGSYFGVGIWFLDSILFAEALTGLVENIDRALRELMRNSNRSAWSVKTIRASQLGINPRYSDEITANEQRAVGVGISGREQQRLGYCVTVSTGGVNDLNLAIDQICFGAPNTNVSRVIIAQDLEAAVALRHSAYAVEIKVERVQNSGDVAVVSGVKPVDVSQPGPRGVSRGFGLADVAVSVPTLQPRVEQIEAAVLKSGRATKLSRWIAIVALVISVVAVFLSSLDLLQIRISDLAALTEAAPKSASPASTSHANPSSPGPTPAAKADGRHGDIQEANAQANPDGRDRIGASTDATRSVEPRYDIELIGLVSEVDGLLRRKEISANWMLKSSLEKVRDEAQKQIEVLKAAQPVSPQPK